MFFDGNDFDFGLPIIPEEINFYKENITKKEAIDNDHNNDLKLVSAKEGFLRGNMFANLFDPYKDLTYLPLKPSSEREELLYEIMSYDFAINDLNLYLDLHPEDSEMYKKFKIYTKECMELKDEYSKKYGPLTLDQIDSKEYMWEENSWPWDNIGGNMYV